jgi:hypothetical protein
VDRDHRAGDGVAVGRHDRAVIRNVVIHVTNEQPLIADLYAMPTSSDAGLVCTNLRMSDGKRPVFIDDSAATFFFPYLVVRFLEIPPGAMARHVGEGGAAPQAAADAPAVSPLPVLVEADAPGPEGETLDIDLDLDEDFLQRVRDI